MSGGGGGCRGLRCGGSGGLRCVGGDIMVVVVADECAQPVCLAYVGDVQMG